MSQSHYAPALEIWWQILKSNHVNPAAVFSKCDLKYADLKNPEHRISSQTVHQIVDEGSKQIDSPCFGVDAYKLWHPGYMGALGYAWLSSSTLRTGFERLSRFLSSVTQDFHINIAETGSDLCISYEYDNKTHFARSDMSLSILLHMCRINYQDTLNPSMVTVAHSRPPCAGNYFAYFKTNVLFDAPYDSISFPLAVVDKELPGSNKHLARINDQILIQYLNELSNDELESRVKKIVINMLPSGRVTCETVAKELAMSHRNLQKKLKELGTSFKEILDDSRFHLAEQYLSDRKLRLSEISYVLGFSEVSSFSRAYKRWSGHSPSL